MKTYIARPEIETRRTNEVAEALKLPVRRGNEPQLLIGRKEWVMFPELGVGPIHAKIDSGARSSSLHVEDILEFEKEGEPWVEFTVFDHFREATRVSLPIEGVHHVKSSSGQGGHRIFVEITGEMGQGFCWPIVVSLTDRAEMKHDMLLGRRALAGYFLIDCHRSHLFGRVEV